LGQIKKKIQELSKVTETEVGEERVNVEQKNNASENQGKI